MKRRGFTLIELLAVIVVLAIIALIATPIVMNVIKDAQEESNKRSIEMYAKALEISIAKHQLENNGVLKGQYKTTDGKNLYKIEDDPATTSPALVVDYNGNVVFNTIIINEDKTFYLQDCLVNNKTVDYKYGTTKVFRYADWQTIADNINSGIYKAGETREIELDIDGDGVKTSYTLRIANTTTPQECSEAGFSQTACGFVIEFEDIIENRSINLESTNAKGWPGSNMYKFANETIYNLLPDELKAVIINTYAVSGHGNTDVGERADGNFESVDKLYLLSYREVFGARHQNDTASGPEHTRQLDYYLNLEVTQSEYQHAIKQFNDDNSCWWLRSALSYKNHRFHYVCPDKVGDSYYAINESGVSLAFRIG